jgi:ribosome-associated heat shock protein Hsp15
MTAEAMTGAVPAIRLDKWLWQARFCKTRGMAARMVSEGRVRLNAARVTKPATPLRVGDGVTFAQGATIRVLRVRALGTRRGPAPEARLLYDDLAPPAPLEPGTGADT